MKTNKNGVKLLATIMVLAIAFAGAFLFVSNDADATDIPEGSVVKIVDSNGDKAGYTSLEAAVGAVLDGETIVLLQDVEIKENIDKSASKISFTIDGQADKKYSLTLNKDIDVKMHAKKTITFSNMKIVNTDTNTPTTGTVTSSDSNEILFKSGIVSMNNVEFTGDEKVEYAFTLTEDVKGTFSKVNFNNKVVGTSTNANTIIASECQNMRINYTWSVTLGADLVIDSKSAATTTLNFAATSGNIIFNLNNNVNAVKFANITERYWPIDTESTDYGYLTIRYGKLSDTTFGTYIGDKDEPTVGKGERSSYIVFDNVTLFGKTVIGAGTTNEDFVTIKGTITLGDAKSNVSMAKTAVAEALTVNASTVGNAGQVILTEITAGDGGLTLSNGSVVIEGGIVVTTDSNITLVSGDASLKSSIPEGMTLTITAGTLTIPAGANVTIDGDVANSGTIINNGTLTINDAIAGGTITNNAIVNLNDSGNVSIANNGSGITYLAPGIVDNTTGNKAVVQGSEGQAFGMKEKLESDYTVLTNAYLQGKLIIPEGITLTIKGVLDLNGEELVVDGKLVVENKGSIVNTKGAGKITLAPTGSIENSGIIGKDYAVKVYDKGGVKYVETKNVSGVEYSLTKESNVYTLTVSGTVSKKGTDYTLNINGAYITDLEIYDLDENATTGTTSVLFTNATVVKGASLTIGVKADVEIGTMLTLKNNAVLVIDGKLTGTAGVHMTNGSIATINGVADTITFDAKTGDYKTYNDANGSRYDVETSTFDPTTDNKTVETKVTFNKINGITLEVTSKSITGADKKPWTTQILNIYGTASYQKGEDNYGAIAINGVDSTSNPTSGSVTVPSGKDLVLSDNTMKFGSTSGAVITTSGLVKVLNTTGIQTTGSSANVKYSGAMYETEGITETGSKYPVYNFTTFDDAFSIIDSVVSKTVTVSGDLELSKDYTVKAGQTVASIIGSHKIAKGATVTVESEGELFNDFQPATETVAAGIQGTLVVKDGATCTPASGSYEVSSKDADNNRTFSGAATAIENAVAGSTIYITNPVIFADKTTIPADVTVDIASGAKVTAQKGLAVNGKIDNEGIVDVTGELTVAGELDNNGTVVVSGNDAAVTVTGKYVGDMASGITPNAAKYNDGTFDVYTSVASAIEAISKLDTGKTVTVTGKISEMVDVTIPADGSITIAGEVVLKSITLSSMTGVTVTEAGKLTADIIGAVGTVDSVGAVSDATVSFSKVVNNITTLKYNEATKTYTMYLGDYTSGDVTVKTGTVTVEGTVTGFTLTSTKTLKVEADSTLVINKAGFTIDASSSKKYFANSGTISLKDSASISKAVVGGEVVVALGKELKIIDSTVTGTITLETKTDKTPASVVIDGKVVVGSAPETLGAGASVSGKVNFNDADAYVVVFSGNTFASDVEGVKSTTYTINGTEFATIFAADGNAVKVNSIDPFVRDLDDLDTTSGIAWKSGTTSAGESTIGKYVTVSADVDYKKVNILISAAPGMLVYIDDFQVVNEKKLAIGQHTVTIYLQPNYEGTPAITFNGQKITDGKITITADMIDADAPTLVVTGATPAVTPTPEPTPEKDDGMGLTDYLLIVLVILAAILVVVVAIRMMRS